MWSDIRDRAAEHIAHLQGGGDDRSRALAQFDVLTQSGSNLCQQIPEARRPDRRR